MEFNDSRLIAAGPAKTWDSLLDPAILKECIPGCESLTGTPETGFEAVVTQRVGPVKATFKGNVTLSDITPQKAMTIAGEGQGGVAGFAKGGADVVLVEEDGGTRLNYAVKAQVGGKLAQLGSRIIDSFTAKLADQFFENFQAIVEGTPLKKDAAPKTVGLWAWIRRLFGR